MNLNLSQRLEQSIPSYISYGVMPNPNQKYRNRGYRTLIVAVFPYYYPQNTRVFSKYCSVYDYHIVVEEEIDRIFQPLGVEYLCMTDVSPFAEKVLAEELGLGQIGRHNLLLTEAYGSFVFIGEVLLKEELPERRFPKVELCTHCNRCVNACPTQALKEHFTREKCLSYLTQKKTLTPLEETILKQADCIWGCDICQLACPVSRRAAVSQIEKFQTPILDLTPEKILSLTEEEFKEQYREFAFCYKGLEILKRNVRLIYESEI